MPENITSCWYCNHGINYDGDKYRDVNCPNCGVENSIYDPSKVEPLPPEPNSITDLLTQEEEVKPPKKSTTEFEKVKTEEMLPGVIEDIIYDQEHTFKGYQGKPDTIQPAVRFKFALDGYKYPHYSRFMKFSYVEKSNLYKTFVSKLVENPKPELDLDLDLLKGMRVKTIWINNEDFQNLESIYPDGSKIKITDSLPTEEPIIEEENES